MISEVRFDLAVFTLDSVKTACYRIVDKCSPSIEVRDGAIVCQLEFDTRLSESAVAIEITNLRKEVLDQDLRQKLKVETEPIRNLILAHAFSRTGLISNE